MTKCVCCENEGRLPSAPGLPAGMVDGSVVEKMCDQCVDAAFLSGGARPHPHPFFPFGRPAEPDVEGRCRG